MASHGEIVVVTVHPFQCDFVPVRVGGGCRKLDEHLAAVACGGDGGAALRGVGPLVYHADLTGFREYPPGVRVRNAGGDIVYARGRE